MISNNQIKFEELHSIAGISNYIKSHFNQIDTDGDGRIGRSDVLQMLSKCQSSRAEDTLASAFLYHYRGNLGTREISLNCQDLDRMSDPKFRDRAQRTLDRLTMKETVEELFPKHRIDPTTILQGALVESKFTATLAALAATPNGDRRIRKMITRNSDGSYLVTFPGDAGHPLHIRETTLQDKMVGSCCADGSQFVTLLERAFSLHRQIMEITKGRWGTQKDPLELLTGKPARKIVPKRNNSLSASANDMRNRQTILQALKNYKAVTLAIADDQCAETSGYVIRRRIAERQARGFQLQCKHTYALIDYNENTRMVTICDASKAAIKDQHGMVQGEINIQLSELERCFSEIFIED
ncbi:MAG TPA: EF-hand domain-containing protein [Drouetiella sp.]|jgi:EF-hand domain